MKKLRCSSCGAELRIEDNNEYAVCDHCGTKYKLKEDLNVNIKLDDNTKEIINNGLGTVKHVSKAVLIPIILFVIIMIVLIVVFAVKSNNNRKAIEENKNQQQEQVEDMIKDFQEQGVKEAFNFQFTNANGTKSDFFLSSILDNIIQSNKTHERQVTLVFDGKETTNEEEIINIKHSLSGDYEVSLDYDDGYVNKIVVSKIS